MATLAQVFNRELLLSYIAPDPLKRSPLVQSGAFASDVRLRPLLTSGSKTFEVPYINGIDANLEPNYGNTIITDIAVPREIDAGSMGGRVGDLLGQSLDPVPDSAHSCIQLVVHTLF